jgi:tetratricopeptide (TPR) repeat protein
MDYFDLGEYSFPVTTNSKDAQIWFDRGLKWIYGYNHEEAIYCFDKAIEKDENCAMAYWGISYAVGPNYNKKWVDFSGEDKSNCVNRSRESLTIAKNIPNLTSVERDLIKSLGWRYPDDPMLEDFSNYNDAYANKMRETYQNHSANLEVCALFAEALMNRTPWQLWEVETGQVKVGASTQEAISVLETAFSNLDYKGANNHPGLLHMYIHLMEMSPYPEKALKAGDALTNLVPDAGHLQHMATHIDVLCGHYENVVRRNHIASKADKKYLNYRGSNTFYTTYVCHNLHFKIYGAMFLGQIKPALEAANELQNLLSEEVVRPSADWLESYYPMKFHVLVRFGMWDEIIGQELPRDGELYCFTTALTHYAKTIAYAATNLIDEAEKQKELFFKAIKTVPETRVLFNNLCTDILAIAADMLEGEVAYRKKEYSKSFDHLRKAVHLDDGLPYEEPWGWMQPVRHALGALLLEQGKIEEAEDVYRADLGIDGKLGRPCQNPDNVWSLHGLHECLRRRGADTEARFIKQRLDLANARADSPILASCFCRLTHQEF